MSDSASHLSASGDDKEEEACALPKPTEAGATSISAVLDDNTSIVHIVFGVQFYRRLH